MVLALAPGLVENLVRLVRRQPLIVEMDGQPRKLAQLARKRLHPRSLRAHIAAHMQRIADHNPCDREPPRQTRNRPQVLPRIAPALQREDRLRRKPKLVAHGNADAFAADVERKITRMNFGFQQQAPGSKLPALRFGLQDTGSRLGERKPAHERRIDMAFTFQPPEDEEVRPNY
jgi:hypothetical protein